MEAANSLFGGTLSGWETVNSPIGIILSVRTPPVRPVEACCLEAAESCMCYIFQSVVLHVHAFIYCSILHWISMDFEVGCRRAHVHAFRYRVTFHWISMDSEVGCRMIPTCMGSIFQSFVLHVRAFTHCSTFHWISMDFEVGWLGLRSFLHVPVWLRLWSFLHFSCGSVSSRFLSFLLWLELLQVYVWLRRW